MTLLVDTIVDLTYSGTSIKQGTTRYGTKAHGTLGSVIPDVDKTFRRTCRIGQTPTTFIFSPTIRRLGRFLERPTVIVPTIQITFVHRTGARRRVGISIVVIAICSIIISTLVCFDTFDIGENDGG